MNAGGGFAYVGAMHDSFPHALVVMQYTGYSTVSRQDAPTYACVGTNDGIANWRTMQNRLNTLSGYGIPTEFHSYPGLSHGFGLGTGTVAAGWIQNALAFWESQIDPAFVRMLHGRKK